VADHQRSRAPGQARRPGGGSASGAPTVADLGEFGLIRRVTEGRAQPASTLLGPGDDAALVAAPDGRVLGSIDMLVEGVHFRLDWSSPEQVGRKAAAVNMADIAAMGARPTGAAGRPRLSSGHTGVGGRGAGDRAVAGGDLGGRRGGRVVMWCRRLSWCCRSLCWATCAGATR